MIRSRNKASSLVITLLVLVVLSTIVVAFLQSMSVERLSAKSVKNAYQARLAAEAGLNQAVARLAGVTNFHFAVGNELITSTNYGLKLFVKQQGATNVTFSTNLFSDGGGTNFAKFKLEGANYAVASYVELTNSSGETTARYAFWTEDENSKQNLTFARGAPRATLTNFNEIALVQMDEVPWPTNAYGLDLNSSIARLTVKSVNQLLTNSGFNSAVPVDDRYFTTKSPFAQLTPEGEPRLNLVKLKSYIDGGGATPALSLLQGPASARVQLVTRLLNEDGNYPATNTNSPWGGGSFAFLTNAYSIQQARQIVANIVDYLDEDLIPTTDGMPGTGPSGSDLFSSSKSSSDPSATLAPQTPPTFIGAEARATSSGSAISVIGHPYITYVGSGFQINSGANPINSTRIYGWLQIVNPWEGINTWRIGSSDGYYVDMQVKLDGTVSGGSRGVVPQTTGSLGYFLMNSLSQVSGYDGSHSGRTIVPRGKVMFPREWHGSGFDLANGWYTINSPSITVSGFQQRVEIARLIYRVGSQRYLIQDLGVLNNLPRSFNPTNAVLGGSSSTIKHPYVQSDWHYVGDPRLNFQSTNWVISTTSGVAMGPVAASSGNQVYSNVVNPGKDGLQGLADSQLWWMNSSVTNHFASYPQGFRPSLPAGEKPMISYSEFGFIAAGAPWQTLRLSGKVNSTNSLNADLRIAEYVDLGILTNRTVNAFGQVMIDGQINVNSRKSPTLIGLLTGLTNAPSASSMSDALLDASTNSLLRPTDIFVRSNAAGVVLTNNFSGDFASEKLYGQIAPALTSSSGRFTVYAIGETLKNGKVISSAVLQATVELVPVTSGAVTVLQPKVIMIKQL